MNEWKAFIIFFAVSLVIVFTLPGFAMFFLIGHEMGSDFSLMRKLYRGLGAKF